MSDDPLCACGHFRSEHDEDQPYECFSVTADDDAETFCACTGFEYQAEEE